MRGGFSIKNNIKVLRAQHSMTQDQLAEKLSVSRQTIISLEKEKYNPSITLAFKLAETFKCKIEDIFIYEGEIE
ncbi:MAG: helix-turn-helix transcriptional regulator [Solibacillus sp.]|uniref:helix-turn-helix transcriptional regulator n=1 Tax=Solibacillus sp. TaxID=1909654 RepID=UPI003315B5B5